MKKLMFACSLMILLISCGDHDKRKYSVGLHTGDNIMNYTSTEIQCDSFQMITPKKILIWGDGVKMNVESENEILVQTNY